MTVKEIREKRAELAKEIRRLADLTHKEKRDFTAEEKSQWDKVNTEYDSLEEPLKRAERLAKIESDQNSPADERDRSTPPGREDVDGQRDRDNNNNRGGGSPTDEDRSLAIQAWFREQCGEVLEERHEDACKRLRFNPRRRHLDIDLRSTADHQRMASAFRNGHSSGAVQRALSAVNAATGGTAVAPGTLVNQLEVAMLQFGGVLQVAETMRTPHGERMQWPTANDTSNSGRQLGESAAVTTLDPSFGAVYWDSYKFTSDEIKVPTELLEDSPFNLEAVLGSMLGERLGRILNTKFTTGTGAGTPKGIVTASSLGVTAASATAITFDEIIRLEHSVDPAYRNDPSSGYMMHDSIMLAVRLLKDGEGRYLWQSGANAGRPDTLNAKPLTINQDMQSSVATATKTMLFGQLNKYKVRMVNSLRLYRLIERHRENDQDAFLAFIRADGNLLEAGVAPVKHLLQA